MLQLLITTDVDEHNPLVFVHNDSSGRTPVVWWTVTLIRSHGTFIYGGGAYGGGVPFYGGDEEGAAHLHLVDGLAGSGS